MVAASTIAIVGLGLSAVGAVGQAVYTQRAASASRRAERLREQQMRLDAMNRRRNSVRQMILAQSLATARQTAQGVGEGSSVIGGAFGQISGEGGRQLSYTNEAEDIGAGIFQANADVASAQGMSSLFGGMGQFGNSVLNNSQQIFKIGTTLFGSSSPGVPASSSPWSPTYSTSPPSAALNIPVASNYYGQGASPY